MGPPATEGRRGDRHLITRLTVPPPEVTGITCVHASGLEVLGYMGALPDKWLKGLRGRSLQFLLAKFQAHPFSAHSCDGGHG